VQLQKPRRIVCILVHTSDTHLHNTKFFLHKSRNMRSKKVNAQMMRIKFLLNALEWVRYCRKKYYFGNKAGNKRQDITTMRSNPATPSQ